MSFNRRTNFVLIIVFLVLIAFFAVSYNESVSTVLSTAAENDKEMLQSYNNEIIKRLTKADNISEWSDIVDDYETIVVTVENSSNDVIIKAENSPVVSALDVKVRTAFEYKGSAYLITSSVFILRDYQKDILHFMCIELLIAVSLVALIIFIIYTIMLRPYRRFYNSIEEYEKTGNFRETKFRGYIGKVYERFGVLTKNLERQQQNQRRIIASISHDIKTPLTSIMGYTERLKKDNISPERRERYIDTVYNKALEIRGLVDEFDEYLSYNMLQSFSTEYMTLPQLCDMIRDEYADELENMGVDFEVVCHDSKKGVMIDKQKMKRVFGNMVGNSVKHFTHEEKKIRIDVETVKNKVIISFNDNGSGVEDDKLELIFEPLYTSDKGRRVAGLGLAICREIVESHGGKICARKSDLGGLEVRIELDCH
ncbi:MAG: sensor histidine kinase [Acutalibacteraceae bacterium]